MIDAERDVVDARAPREFAEGHIPNSYGIPVGAPLSTWAGWVLPFRAPIILIADDRVAREDAVRQLIRIGFDDLHGYLEGGIAAWQAEGFPVSRVPALSVEEFYAAREHGDSARVLDVRQNAEWRAGHLPRAIHVEGGRLPFGDLPIARDEPLVVHCGHGDRSTVAISILERRRYRDLRLMYGGFSAWASAGYPTTRLGTHFPGFTGIEGISLELLVTLTALYRVPPGTEVSEMCEALSSDTLALSPVPHNPK